MCPFIDAQSQLIQTLLAEHKALLSQNNILKEQLRLSLQRKFGRSTESSNALQLSLFEEEVAAPLPEDDALETVSYTRRKKQKGRNLDTSQLPRERQIHDLPDEQKLCACGCALKKIGEDISEQIDFVPAQLKVIEHVRPKYICRTCEMIKSQPKPPSPIPKSMATAGLISEVIIKKYEHHLPLYRQSKIFAGQGALIPDNTLGNWVMQAAEVLSPLGEVLWEQINTVKVLQADETTLKILSPNKKGYLWGYHSCDPDNRFVIFEFNQSRAANVVNQRLQGFQGVLQTDGYSGYNAFRHHEQVVNVGCWDHARRKFTEVIKVNNNNKSGIAGKLLKLIGELYKIEAQIKELPYGERKVIRQLKAKLLLDKIDAVVKKVCAPPKSMLGKAIAYLRNNWSFLIEYINHGNVQISNCWIENQIRPIALGRKNWLFAGNALSANRGALLFSLIQSCKLNGIDPRAYLVYVLNQAHNMRKNIIDVASILPQFIDKSLV